MSNPDRLNGFKLGVLLLAVRTIWGRIGSLDVGRLPRIITNPFGNPTRFPRKSSHRLSGNLKHTALGSLLFGPPPSAVLAKGGQKV